MGSHSAKLHIIRYEDLIHSPDLEFRALGRWLGVDPSGLPKEMITDTILGKYKRGLSEEE
jgi:hypothetical protein